MFLPLSHEFIRRAHVGDLRDIIVDNGFSITIADKIFKSIGIATKMRKSEIQEYLMNVPHVRDTEKPSWFDLFCEVQETSRPIADKVTKSELRKLVGGSTTLTDVTLRQIFDLSPTAFNLRTLLAKLEYVRISIKNMSLERCCEMLGFVTPKWGYQKDVILWAKHCGFTNAERHAADKSYEYLGIQGYPKTIHELSTMDVESYNRDVEQIRCNLKLVIRDMCPRTKLVKYRMVALFNHDFGITERVDNSTPTRKLNEIIDKYNL